MITKIENNNMNEVLEQDFAVVDFSAVWCGPCKMLEPVLEEISEDMAADTKFYNIDSDENMELAGKFQVQSIPSLFIMKKGEVVAQSVGFQPKAQIESWINSYK